MHKRLYRSRTDCKFAGVCGGLGEYFNIDPTLIRIITVVLFFAHGVGLLAYIIAWIAMPKEPLQAILDKAAPSEQAQKITESSSTWVKFIPGLLLIAIGLFFLFEHTFWWFHFHLFWPILLILFGIILLIGFGRRNHDNIANQGEVA